MSNGESFVPPPSIDNYYKLFTILLKKGLEEDYGGHEDYYMMLDAVDSDIPIYGCNVTVRKENPKTGQIYTVNYHVKVYDDMGHVIDGPDDVGGRCAVDGAIAAKGYISTCEHCGKFVCREHSRFMKTDDDREICLCRYGYNNKDGCFYMHEDEYWPIDKDENREIRRLQKQREILEAKAALESAKTQLEDAERDRRARKEIEGPSIFRRLLTGGPPSIRCPRCGSSPYKGWNVTCPRPDCRTAFWLRPSAPRLCPYCREPITQVFCDRCNDYFEV